MCPKATNMFQVHSVRWVTTFLRALLVIWKFGRKRNLCCLIFYIGFKIKRESNFTSLSVHPITYDLRWCIFLWSLDKVVLGWFAWPVVGIHVRTQCLGKKKTMKKRLSVRFSKFLDPNFVLFPCHSSPLGIIEVATPQKRSNVIGQTIVGVSNEKHYWIPEIKVLFFLCQNQKEKQQNVLIWPLRLVLLDCIEKLFFGI